MAKKKVKDSTPMSLSIDSEVLKKLEAFCEKERRSKTSAIELAILHYLEDSGFEDDGGGK